MTLDHFNKLDDIKQEEILIEEGVLIADRVYRGFKILLFQVNKFYVEAYYNLYYNVVQGVHSFENTDHLDPYLKKISIPSFPGLQKS
jgi:hypothetical protein